MPNFTNYESRTGHLALLTMVVIAAAFLRTVEIDSQGLWTDEGLTLVLSNWPVSDMFLLPTDPTPALYYTLHKLFLSAQSPIGAIRSISLVAGVIAILVMYAVGRLALGRGTGLLAAALLAVWSPHVDYSQEARAYSLLLLLTLTMSCGLIFYDRLLQEEKAGLRAGRATQRLIALSIFGISSVLSFYTHVVAAFWIALTSLILISAALSARKIHLPELIAVFAVMAAFAAPGIYRLSIQVVADDQFTWVKQASPLSFITSSADMFLPIGLWDNRVTNALGITRVSKGVVIVASVLSLLFALWYCRRSLIALLRARPVLPRLIFAYFTAAVLIWAIGYLGRPIYIDRVILFAVPGMILLITAIVASLNGPAATKTGLAVVALYTASVVLIGPMREREDWRGASDYLAGAASPSDLIVICPRYNYPSLRYHTKMPTGSAVLVGMSDGTFADIEAGLGTDQAWDKTYFQRFTAPAVTGPQPTDTAGRAAERLDLRAGQVIWRVDGHCGADEDAKTDRFLSIIAQDSGVGWRQIRKDPSSNTVAVRRYVVPDSVAVEIRRLAAPH